MHGVGEVTEWSIVQHWKCCVGETPPRVRIPPSPLKAVPVKTGEFPPLRPILGRHNRPLCHLSDAAFFHVYRDTKRHQWCLYATPFPTRLPSRTRSMVRPPRG